MIVPIALVISKNFEMIWATGSFHIIVLTTIKTRDVGSSAISLGQTIEFLCVFCNTSETYQSIWPCYPLFLSTLQCQEARRVPQRHCIMLRTWWHGLSLVSNSAHMRCEHFCITFFDSSGVQAECILDYWIKRQWWSLLTSRSYFDSKRIVF